ncbi:MAG: type II 3-dehydroquinate dehydratase [Flavobacteriales bacterium]|jgi:3-dehydroquinate dehydratase-2|nr:type II 3-dehydroquinate dehydratase [Flavobacteriales bacterium]
MKKIRIINGPNLNLLGTREQSIYGNQSFEHFLNDLRSEFGEIHLEYFQSNHEGAIIDWIQEGALADGIILNAGGYTHTSVAIRDAISSIQTPVIEVHISNIYQRESFRHKSLLSAVCKGIIAGFGLESYRLAILSLKK